MTTTTTIFEQKEALEALKDSLPIMLEYEAIQAQLTRARFLALRLQGFDDAQCIQLCKGDMP